MYHPVINNPKRTIIYAAVWMLIAAVHMAVLYSFYNVDFLFALGDSLVFNILFAVLGISIWYLVKFNGIKLQDYYRIGLTNLTGAFFLISIWMYSGFSLMKIFFSIEKEHFLSFDNSITWRIATGFLYYLVLSLVYYLFIYYENLQERITKEVELKNLVREAELNALKSQINPHFLFNSLNSISSLTITDPPKAQEMIIKLSAFLRYSLSLDEKQTTSFRQELQNCEYYLEIEKIRFGEKLNYKKKIEPGCESMKVPNLILQPLLENAIKHGVYESVDQITIEISCKKQNGNLEITLQNDFDPEYVPKKRSGIGLKNLRDRLFLIYNKKNLMKIIRTENKFIVLLIIPQN